MDQNLALLYQPGSLQTTKPKFNSNLEALRAIAALVVVWHHTIVHPFQLDPNFAPTGTANFNPPGHFAVLIFFILSGYVIGLAHHKPLTTWSSVKIYVRKRFTRIYPIYAVSLIFAVVVSGFKYSIITTLGHLIFCQIIWVPLIFENNPLWSLQYEMLFYLLFIPLSSLRISPILVTIVSIFLSFITAYLANRGIGGTSYSYFVGFSFWALGWALGTVPTSPSINYRKLISALLLLLAIGYFNVLQSAYTKMATIIMPMIVKPTVSSEWPESFISPIDFAALPFALLIILQFINYENKYFRWTAIILYILPAYTLIYIARNFPKENTSTALLPILFYIISVFIFFYKSEILERCSKYIISKIGLIGSISYGLYVIHFPIISIFHRITIFSGSIKTFSIRFVIYAILSIATAYWLEKKFQPFIKKIL
ncbi:hypothetical protein CDA63_11660 [Hymenobacter amundsenii]|uniref:Acyltransferase 3 domain-containing protein n=1 Tax=Hymenobacter amundsenii TaxID=2006685 RepID=A0A246FJY4_9BACT|nr:acyltransferase [Hymenobacter amundsenii]OWP62867.1 hypothetical protein CDA63_11660 [Hymenobacter amundsenii]